MEDTEVHRVLLISTINFVKLRDLVPLWRKKTCRSGLNIRDYVLMRLM
jgi:hypothetical protein